MAKIPKRIKRSYDSYLKYREQYKSAGAGLDRELTLEEYEQAHLSWAHYNAKNPKKTHIAREIAKEEQTFTRSEAAGVIRRLEDAELYNDVDKEALKALREKYSSSKVLRSFELSPEEAAATEQRVRENRAARGKSTKETIQSSYRGVLFNELLDAGLSYREADKVVYG